MAIRDLPQVHLRLTEAGSILLQGIACILLAALIVPSFGILAALAAVLLTALVAGFILRPRVRIQGDLPESVIVGQTVPLRYQISNAARVSAYDLSVEIDTLPASIERLDSDPFIPRLAPGATAEVSLALKANARGRFRIPPPVCRSSFPFNMFVFGASRDGEQTLLALPPVFPLRLTLAYRSRHACSSGSGFAGRTEVSPEYAGNRPFVSGDSPRRIDVRAWARLSVPATKEYYNDHDSLASLVLDSRVSAHWLKNDSGQIEAFEAAVCLCASAAFTLDQSCSIDSVWIGSTPHQFADVPRPDRFSAIHHMLATVEPSDDYDLEPVCEAMAGDWPEISEVVFILLAWDEPYGELIEQAARAGCHTTVLLLGNSATARSSLSNLARIPADSATWAASVAVLSPHDVLEGRVGDL